MALDLETGLRWVSPFLLLWLAYVFGRTLRAGSTALIERIARCRDRSLSAELRRYTRSLTAIWCGYFVGAAMLSAMLGWSNAAASAHVGIAVAAGSLVLFVGEHWVRQRIFPHETFPGLLQQVRDTWTVWQAREDRGTQAGP